MHGTSSSTILAGIACKCFLAKREQPCTLVVIRPDPLGAIDQQTEQEGAFLLAQPGLEGEPANAYCFACLCRL